MAAEVGQRFCSGWSYSDVPYNDHHTPTDASVQQMVLDHGSVSFGRFAAESLSWEKRSVFDHNRRQEELSNLTMPGLVAQKKAFFEEYYKRARLLKAQEEVNQTEVTSEEGTDHYDTNGHNIQEPKLPAVSSEDPVASAPSSSFEPSTEVISSGDKKCQDPHGLGYLTFNPLFSQITGSQNIQQEGSISDQMHHTDGDFPCATHTNTKDVLNHEPLERKVLAPKHIVSNDNGENVVVSRIVLPIASLQQEHLKIDLQRQESRKNALITSVPTKSSKEPSTSVIHIPRIDSRRNSENRNSQELKDPFHKRVEMKLRALSDRMNADKATASSRSVFHQHAERAVTSSRSSMTSCRSSTYQNCDRVVTSSRSALCQNADRVHASSKAAQQASHRSLRETHGALTLPRAVVNKGSHVCRVAPSNSSTTQKFATSRPKHSVMPNSSQNANTIHTAQVSLKRSAGVSSVNNRLQNKRKQLSAPSTWDENKLNRGYALTSAPSSARSSSVGVLPYKTAKAPKISNGKNVVVKQTAIMQKSTNGSHPAGGRNVQPKNVVSCNEQKRKVTPLQATSSLSSSTRNNLASGPSMGKSKPRQERPRWR